LYAAATAKKNPVGVGAWITGVRSAPKYRFWVITVTVVPPSARGAGRGGEQRGDTSQDDCADSVAENREHRCHLAFRWGILV